MPSRTDQDYCYPKHIGYKPADIISAIDGTPFSKAASDTVDGLTRVMILHPIACAVAFISFALSCGAGVVGSLLGAMVAALAWVLTLVVMAVDFSLFGVRNQLLSHVLTEYLVLTNRPGNQKSCQQTQGLSCLLLCRNVDMSHSHDTAILRHVHCPLHMLQCPEGEEGQLQNKRRLLYHHEDNKAQTIWIPVVDESEGSNAARRRQSL